MKNEYMRKIIKDLLPPVLFRRLLGLLKRGTRFEGPYPCWSDAVVKSSGYDSDLILNKVLQTTMQVRDGDIAGERDSVVLDEIEYSWPVTSALMWVAANNGGTLKVLDFGGSLGTAYFQNQKFLRFLDEVSWGVIEQNNFVTAGKKYIQNDQLQFYYSIAEYLEKNSPDVVLLGSVLQYLENPMEIMNLLAKLEAVIIVDRTPFTDDDSECIYVQRVPSSIYSASYPVRVLSESALIPAGYLKVASFSNTEGSARAKKCSFTWRGFVLEPTGHIAV